MSKLRDDEIEIRDQGKACTMKILFTCDYKEKQVVFFMGEDPEEEDVYCAYYDDEGHLEQLEEEDYGWAQRVLEDWEKEQENADE